MTAKEFYELNKGKYFMYKGHKVRVVGYNKYSILTAGNGGWEYIRNKEQGNFFIDGSLITHEDKLWYLDISDLKPIEPELDLCKILKGCEGMVFYSTMVGYCRLIEITEYITISHEIDECLVLEPDGKYATYGECTLFQSKESRDWSTFVNPIKIKEGTPVMTKWNSAAFWKLESYTKDNKSDFIVPVSDFDFTDFDSNKSKSIV